MKQRIIEVEEITFTADELEQYSHALWNMGFTACSEEFRAQRENPNHPITRAIPMEAKQYWKRFNPIE